MRPGAPGRRFGRRGWTQTSDPQLRRLMLIHLSYAPVTQV